MVPRWPQFFYDAQNTGHFTDIKKTAKPTKKVVKYNLSENVGIADQKSQVTDI
jgi:hypothetical protein